MALERIIIRPQRSIDGIQIDGILKESTTVSVRTTSNPVESGRDITDHVIINPIKLVLEGVISDAQLGAAGIANITNTIGGVFDQSGIFGSSTIGGQTRSQQLYGELVTKLQQRQLLTITTKLKEYDNLVFESISVDQDKDTSQSVFFTATFAEVLIVTDAIVRNAVKQNNIGDDDAAASYSEYENGGFFDVADATSTQASGITP